MSGIHFNIENSTIRAAALAAGLSFAYFATKYQNKTEKKAEEDAYPEAVIVVDPLSTGAMVGHEFLRRGIPTIRVWSQNFPAALGSHVKEGLRNDYCVTIQHNGNFDHTVRQIKSLPFRLKALVTGCETGVNAGDIIAEALGLPGNSVETSLCRRDKYLMGERIRAAGVRAVKQCRCTTWEEIEAFMTGWNPNPFEVVIKPIASAGSDGVFKCNSMEELKAAFDEISRDTNENIMGYKNVAVVVQEFIAGTEYVVDSVSRDGVHKTVSVWKYDKRSANGKNFIYHGIRLMSSERPEVNELITYMHSVLDALSLRNGPSHGEVYLTPTGPCLVEVGARPHGGDGTWHPIPIRCLGYSQVTASVEQHLNPDVFYKLPARPVLTHTHGSEVYFVSRVDGMLRGLPHVEEIKALPSFAGFSWNIKVDRPISKTIDCMTQPGSVTLVHNDEEQLEKDIEEVRRIELRPDFFLIE